MGTAIILDLYRGSVLANILLPSYLPRFRNLEELTELLEKNEITVITPANSGWLQSLKDGIENDKSFGRLQAALDKRPIKDLGEFKNIGEALIYAENTGDTIIYTNTLLAYYGRKFCGLELIELTEFSSQKSSMMFIFNRDAPREMMRRINESIAFNMPKMVSVQERYNRLLFNRKDWNCTGEVATGTISKKPIEIHELIGFFFAYLLGSVISGMVFGIEHVFKRIIRKIKTQAVVKKWLEYPQVRTADKSLLPPQPVQPKSARAHAQRSVQAWKR